MRPIPRVKISLSVVDGRGSGALFLHEGLAWQAVVTVDGVASTEIRIAPSSAVRAALVGHYRRAGLQLPAWVGLTVAQIEVSEARAMIRAQAAFADEVKEFATVEE